MQSITEQFKAFVRSKPADETYDWENRYGCAFCHFLVVTGYPVLSVDPGRWTDTDRRSHAFDAGLEPALRQKPWTFGALADRLSRIDAKEGAEG